jgi:hypothetical protein
MALRASPPQGASVGSAVHDQRRRAIGLARAVRPDHAEHLAGIHLEGNVSERRLVAIALGQPGDLQQARLADRTRGLRRARSGIERNRPVHCGNGRLAFVHAQSSRRASVAQRLDETV